jgi:hypothetical protein
VLIAAGTSIKAAATEVECGERTAHTWLEDPRYRALVAELRHRMLDEAVGNMIDASNKAVGTRRNLLDHSNGNVRLRAALGILDGMLKLREHVELSARILRLEQAQNQDVAEPPKRIHIPDVDGRWHRADPHDGPDA